MNHTNFPFPLQRHFFRQILITAFALLPLSLVQAETSVWRVKSDSNTLYLGGTFHLLRSSDFPLPIQYELIYGVSDELYFETDVAAISGFSSQAKMAQGYSYTDGITLQSVLNEEAYDRLTDFANQTGLPLSMVEKYKPVYYFFQLGKFLVTSQGLTSEGVDAYFFNKGKDDGKAIGYLETVDEHIQILTSLGEGNESEFILAIFSQTEQPQEDMNDNINHWRNGDYEGLEKFFVETPKKHLPIVYDALLKQRNHNWMPQIEEMLKDADTEFVLVGVGHLVGEDGLVELLQAKGYEVTQL